MMKIKFLIGVVIIVIIGLYIVNKNKIFLTFDHPAEQESTENSKPDSNQNTDGFPKEKTVNSEKILKNETDSKNIVNYTDAGFNPSSLEIKVGQTVQFVNQSGGGMWVASGPHPSHTGYPEFDPKRNIPSGEIYEFTFTKIGEWKYHNHTKSGMYGTIIVK